MGREFIVEDVREWDSLYSDAYTITYARSEGATFEVLVYNTEAEANRILNEYVDSGTLTLRRWVGEVEDEVIKPVVMFKSKVVTSYRSAKETVEIATDN